MNKAIGMVEYKTVSAGISAADLMIKSADTEVIQASTVCPGKYIIIVSGALSAVNASVEAARTALSEQLIDSFVLGNPAEEIFPALYGGAPVENAKALGVLETFSAPSIIVAGGCCGKGGGRFPYRNPCRKRYVRQVVYASHRRGCGSHGGN